MSPSGMPTTRPVKSDAKSTATCPICRQSGFSEFVIRRLKEVNFPSGNKRWSLELTRGRLLVRLLIQKMNCSRHHTKVFSVAWLGLSLALAISGDVIADVLIDEIDIPISADALPTQDTENPAEDILLSPRFVAFDASDLSTCFATEGINVTSVTLRDCVLSKRFRAKDHQLASTPARVLTPLRI